MRFAVILVQSRLVLLAEVQVLMHSKGIQRREERGVPVRVEAQQIHQSPEQFGMYSVTGRPEGREVHDPIGGPLCGEGELYARAQAVPTPR